MRRVRIVVGAAVLAGLMCEIGCSSTTIAIKEKLGHPKREQLVSRVTDAKDSQEAAKKQFATALDEFLSVTGTGGGDLEAKYRKLQAEYDRSVGRAGAAPARS